MRKISLLLLVLFLCALYIPAAAEDDFSEEDIDIAELLEMKAEIEEDQRWSFPVALRDMNPEYVRLVNKHYLLEADYVPEDLVKIPRDPDKGATKGGVRWDGSQKDGKLSGQYLREECAEALVKMNADMRAITDSGVKGWEVMYVKSAYRSYSKQNSIYGPRLRRNKGKDDGWVAKPGTSDHQTGLGCDFIPYNWTKKDGMNSKMAREDECIWMAEHCHEYGFIIRYPEDKTEITEINFEPWHLRYVGIPAATYIMENGLCLEEFTEQLQAAIGEYLAQDGDYAKVEAFIQKPSAE